MSEPDRTRPSDDGAGPPDAACAAAHAALPAYLEGRLGLGEQRRMRAHHALCRACRARFDEALRLAAGFNHQPRRARAEHERVERRRSQRRRALAGAFFSPRDPRNARLRLLLLPAFFIFLMTVVSRGPRAAAGASLSALAGEVLVGDGSPVAPGESRPILRGELCATGAAARARLTLGSTQLDLGADTWVWLESSTVPRVRLGGGTLALRGTATVTSSLGVVEVVAGSARLGLGREGLTLESFAGEVRAIDSRGVQALPAGETCHLSGPGG